MDNGDDAQIRNLLARLAHSGDTGDVDSYCSLFTDDAVWEMPANPLTGLAADRRQGVADIRAGVEARRAVGVQGPGSHTQHVVTTACVDVDGDHAAARSYWQFYGETATKPELRGMGRYLDTMRRTATGWKLAQRTVVTG